jgi:DivIVA domain-containing protein
VPLTPVEVEHARFRVAFRGYAKDEVDAFLDRVQSELARLLGQEHPTPALTSAAAAPGAAVQEGPEGSEPALRTLLLAQRTADEAVGEARAQADRLRAAAEQEAGSTVAAARDEAQRTLASARAEADATLASARQEAERVLATSRAEAARLDEQIAARLEAALGDLDGRRSRLEARITELQAFEREYRTRLRAYLEGQLRELASSGAPDDDGAGVPVGAGGAPVSRTAVRVGRPASPDAGAGTPSYAGSPARAGAPDPVPTPDR